MWLFAQAPTSTQSLKARKRVFWAFLGKKSNWGECGALELGWGYRRKVYGIQVVVLWSF